MKSEKGITLTSLVIYVIVATLLISSISLLSSYFFSNMSLIKDKDKYAIEFNKFSMFFINDVKNNESAEVTSTSVIFEDGTAYQYISKEQAVYRNDIKITEELESFSFTSTEIVVSHTTKQIINVQMTIDGKQNASNGIEYVLKYW